MICLMQGVLLAFSLAAQDTWSPIASAGPTQGSNEAVAVWTGEEMLVWGGNPAVGSPTNLGLRYNPRSDAWSVASPTGAPLGRHRHTGIWTGRELIVWGGLTDLSATTTNSGGRYDPKTDAWSPVSLTGAPSARHSHSAVWTGREMIVWGGLNSAGVVQSTGARYDPRSDTWSSMTATGEPSARAFHAAVWTGRQMLVWGGSPTGPSGGRYDPLTDAWSPITTVGAPADRSQSSAVWTGREMIVWGGDTGIPAIGYVNTGGRYDPVSDSWSPTSLAGAPTARIYQSTVWTGREMILWGGLLPGGAGTSTDDGSRYDPTQDAWVPLPSLGRPGMRALHVAVWTGLEMIVFGGKDYATTNGLFDGGSYRPPISPGDVWGTISTIDAPEPRVTHSAVWTGREMIIWGGTGLVTNLDTGGRYDFITKSWTATSTSGAPTRRPNVNSVWTGREMIIWGHGSIPNAQGGRYDPPSDTWTLISQTGEPADRIQSTMVWTGRELIVWGGSLVGIGVTGDGARYDPKTDTWSPISMTGAPSARVGHSAVWTGREMIIWGGGVPNPPGPTILLNGGARYDPRTDTWAPLSTTGAPTGRSNPTALWTGSEMLIWGGEPPLTNTGGRYSPSTDTWASTSTVNAPTGRRYHSAVWTGSEMIVWGGQDLSTTCVTGGRYSPFGDLWSATTTTGIPSPRIEQSGVWTDRYLAIWGGNDGTPSSGATNSGGIYGFEPLSPVNSVTAVENCTASISSPTSPVPLLCLALGLAFLALRRTSR